MKYKALNTGYPKVTFPENTEFVNREMFLTDEPDRIALLIGTQFGIIPKEFSDFKKLPFKKIAIIPKSLLSGLQLELKIYNLNKANKMKQIVNSITSNKFTASFIIGLQKGYSKELHTNQDVINVLQQEQEHLIQTKNVYLSAVVSSCEIVLSGQVEPSVKLEFINYPKFPLDNISFKKHILELAENLIQRLEQNRTVVVFHDEIMMLEVDERIDPRINRV